MKYADFRDRFFDFLTKSIPADQRFPLMQDSVVKHFLQKLDYTVDRVFVWMFIGVFMPALFIVGRYVTWLNITN